MDSTITEYFRKRRTAITPRLDGPNKKGLIEDGLTIVKRTPSSIAPPKASTRKQEAEQCLTPVKPKRGPAMPPTPAKRVRKFTPDPNVELPERYRTLLEIFKATELTIARLENRHEVCTFRRLAEGIEALTKKRFTMLRLAEIMTILPQAYNLRYDYSLPDYRSFEESPTGRTHKLVIEIKVEDNQAYLQDRLNLFKEKLSELAAQGNPDKDPLSQVEPLEIEGYRKVPFTARRKLNFNNLLTKDDNHNEIPATSATSPIKSTTTARQLFTPPTTPIKSSRLTTPTKSSLDATTPIKNGKLLPSPRKISNGPLKGLSCTLLDRIRSKEMEACNSHLMRKKEILATLPELARTIHTFFTIEKKECLPFDKVVNRCATSSTMSVTATTICESIDLLLDVAPEWISTIKVTKGRYMRIKRDYNLTYVHETISNYKIDT